MSRESPELAVGGAFSDSRVGARLPRLESTWGLPKSIQVDIGPQFTSKARGDSAHRRRIKLVFSRLGHPGTPTANPYIAAYNGRFRAECLDQHGFAALEEVPQGIEA